MHSLTPGLPRFLSLRWKQLSAPRLFSGGSFLGLQRRSSNLNIFAIELIKILKCWSCKFGQILFLVLVCIYFFYSTDSLTDHAGPKLRPQSRSFDLISLSITIYTCLVDLIQREMKWHYRSYRKNVNGGRGAGRYRSMKFCTKHTEVLRNDF